MNLIGVIIQLLFPCAPPWYENLYGLAPANYSMAGSPAGLARVDQLFGVDLYTSSFTASPMVFGAFPSLHSGCGTTEALFMAHVFPQFTPLLIGYILWLWWATMYLSHHYVVDLVGGSIRKLPPWHQLRLKLTIHSGWSRILCCQGEFSTSHPSGQETTLGLRLCGDRG